MSPRLAISYLVTLTLLVSACGGGGPTDPGLDLSDSVALPGSSTLVFNGGGAFGEHRDRVEEVIRSTFDAARARLPLNGVTIVARNSLDNVIGEIGIGGRADAGTVWMSFDTNGRQWVSSIDSWLGPLLAHELHHVARFRAVGFYDNLLEAMVGEGAADRFLMELTGASAPMWSTALTPAQFDELAARAEDQWFDGDYDHAAWFYGTSDLPRWAGYTIGFEIVGDHMDATGRTAADLYAEPAESFVGR